MPRECECCGTPSITRVCRECRCPECWGDAWWYAADPGSPEPSDTIECCKRCDGRGWIDPTETESDEAAE